VLLKDPTQTEGSFSEKGVSRVMTAIKKAPVKNTVGLLLILIAASGWLLCLKPGAEEAPSVQSWWVLLFLPPMIAGVYLLNFWRRWDLGQRLKAFISFYLSLYGLHLLVSALVRSTQLQASVKRGLLSLLDPLAALLAITLTISFGWLYYPPRDRRQKILYFAIIGLFFITLQASGLFFLLVILILFQGLRLPWLVTVSHTSRIKLFLILAGFWISLFFFSLRPLLRPEALPDATIYLGGELHYLFMKTLLVYILLLTIRMAVSLVETSQRLRSKTALSYLFRAVLPIVILIGVILVNFIFQGVYFKFHNLYQGTFQRLEGHGERIISGEELRQLIRSSTQTGDPALALNSFAAEEERVIAVDFPGTFLKIQLTPSEGRQGIVAFSPSTPPEFRRAETLPRWFMENMSPNFFAEKGKKILKCVKNKKIGTEDVLLQLYVPITGEAVEEIERRYQVTLGFSPSPTGADSAINLQQDTEGHVSATISLPPSEQGQQGAVTSGAYLRLPLTITDWENGGTSQLGSVQLFPSWKDVLSSSYSFDYSDPNSYLANTKMMAYVTLIVALIIIIISSFIGGRISKRIQQSLDSLVIGTRKIGEGDLDYKIGIKSRDEFYALATSFNLMTDNLKKYMAEMVEKERIEYDIKTASKIQSSILPERDPSLEGYDVISYFHPAKEVGGDYYDYLCLPNNQLGIVIGDVSGHGIAAGLLMSMAKSCLYNQVKTSHQVEEVLFAMNNMVNELLHKRLLMSFCYTILDLKKRRLTYSSAGHHFPYHYSASEATLSSLESIAYPLGVRRNSRYDKKTAHLKPGDLLIFYSDGIIETMDNKDELFGFERFEELIVRDAHLPPTELKQSILRELKEFARGTPQGDDIALIIIKVK